MPSFECFENDSLTGNDFDNQEMAPRYLFYIILFINKF